MEIAVAAVVVVLFGILFFPSRFGNGELIVDGGEDKTPIAAGDVGSDFGCRWLL